jgi:hypothetical protein
VKGSLFSRLSAVHRQYKCPSPKPSYIDTLAILSRQRCHCASIPPLPSCHAAQNGVDFTRLGQQIACGRAGGKQTGVGWLARRDCAACSRPRCLLCVRTVRRRAAGTITQRHHICAPHACARSRPPSLPPKARRAVSRRRCGERIPRSL